MAVQTMESIKRLPPYLEGLQKRLLQTMFGVFDGETQTSPGLIDKPLDLPETKIAGLDPLQQKAMQEGEQMFGSFQPTLDQAKLQQLMGVGAIGSGLGMLDPSQGIQKFMDPYQESVIDEVNRRADAQKRRDAAQAVNVGAFGGSREGIVRAATEGQRQANIGRLLSQGFQNAVQASQKAGQLMGGLGQAFGQGASSLADIARLQSQLGQSDIGLLSQLGSLGQKQSQAQLDAQKQNLLQGVMAPFTQLQLGSQLLQGMPSGNLASTFQTAVTPRPNPFMQGVGAISVGESLRGGGSTSA
tara:strand:- start:263 stop:1162 length:900 start_codon:yes stop_codon:yes gene_type:complete